MTSLRHLRLSILACVCLVLLAPPRGAGAQEQPLITQIDVVGARKVEEATVRFKLKSRIGDPYSPEVVREDIKSLYSLGYFEDIVVQADIFEGGLKLIFVLHEKPSIQSITIVGNRKLSTDKVRTKIDLVEGAIVPPGGLPKNAEKIRLFYEEEGYYQAQVTGTEERVSPQEVALTFTIVEGDKFDVGEIRIVGNQYLKEKDIKGKIQTSELFLFFFGGTLKREELRRDLDRIRAYYLDNGFLDIAVDEPEIQLDTERKKLRIIIPLQEGPQYRIRALAIKGNHLLSEPEIRGLMRSGVGGVFSRETLQGDVVAITDRYAERGYLFADVAPVTDVQRAETTVDVAIEITEGRQAFISRIEITGNVRTRDKVIRRELQLVEGDVFNSALLQASRRNIQNLGYFEDVKLDTKRAAAEDRVDVSVDVKEKSTGAFTIGGGYSSLDGAIGVASISQTNLFGLGKSMVINAQIGQNANRGNATYTDPHFLDSDFILQPQLFAYSTNFASTQSYNQANAGVSLTVGHLLYWGIFGSITYTYQEVKIKDVQEGAPAIVVLQANESGGKSLISSLTFTLTRDTRDSPTEATRGLLASASYSYAGGILGASSNYYKTALDLSQYWPLWWRLVGHVHASIAYGDSFGDTPSLPIQDRYWLGGMSSVRGFKNLSISPTDVNGTKYGGNKAFFIQSEILFPLLDALRMRGLVFYDLGNSFAEDTPYKWIVKRAAGVGIRFMSPLGAISLDWGFNLNKQPGEKSQVISFSAGRMF